ncbi:MAG TPA: mannosyltransferase family protein [Aggregatilineaceae bacterium]|nr:mannosyltransferase family protein [Aggregatilineaceae bacterium]
MFTASGSPKRRLLADPAVRRITALWAGWVVILLLFQAAAWLRLDVTGPDTSYGWTEEHSTGTPRSGVGLAHVRWDSYHYLRLARFGYHYAEDAAYYPAYPVLMRGVALAIVRPLMPWADALRQYAVAGLAISIVATLPATWTLHALAREVLRSDDDALRVTVYGLIFPTAFFMLQVYTEALYLALAIPALLMAVRRRWWLAGALAALATITRATGFLLVGAIGVYWYTDWRAGRRPRWASLGAVALPGAALLAHRLFLRLSDLDQDAAFASYGRAVLNPAGLRDISHQLGQMLTDPMGAVQISLDVALPALALWACWRVRRLAPGLALYGAAVVILPVITGTLVSLNRYALAATPAFLGLALAGRDPLFDRLWTLASALILALYLVAFAHGYWVG